MAAASESQAASQAQPEPQPDEAKAQAAPEPEPQPEPARGVQPGVRWHDRVFVAGSSGSGKSEILNHLFTGIRCQRLLLDTKPEFLIDGVPVARRPDAIDWDQPVIHYRPSSHELDEYDELFYACYHRRNLLVVCHELGDLCEDQPGKAPRWVRRYIRGGNIHGNGLYGGSQRTVGIPRQARTESFHVVAMVPGLDPEDHDTVARMMRLRSHELARELNHAADLGEYSCVWADRRARITVLRPPLPDQLRQRIIVRRAVNL